MDTSGLLGDGPMQTWSVHLRSAVFLLLSLGAIQPHTLAKYSFENVVLSRSFNAKFTSVLSLDPDTGSI